ncbi:MAG: ATP-binding cassette domain-containing protein [Candidatus Sumerlaeota bacterium]|nr:ATP-binding cassette domain-containing protein [Candidatus Sumerlaeota bacterium]
MIQINGLAIRAGAFHREGISFAVPTGKYAILMGRTGCGKTTLLETICGLLEAPAGEIRLYGREVSHLKPAQRGIGYVPQDVVLFNNLTVAKHLSLALEVRRWPRKAIRERVGEMAQLLGIERLLRRKPYGLSGGEQHRVALGRALSFRPHVLCLDEPLSGFDAAIWEEICQLLQTVQRQTGVTTLHVTHHREEAERLGDVILEMENIAGS